MKTSSLASFNVFTVALEIPIADLFPNSAPQNGVLQADSSDSLLRVWFNISRREKQNVGEDNVVTGYGYQGKWKQVGRNALLLFNAGLVGTSRQTKYLRSSPMQDVSNFGADILFPVLVRDAEVLGIYAAPGINPDTAIGPRVDIINVINLGRPIPIDDGCTGEVVTLDSAIDSQFPNGRRIDGGSAPNKEQVDVSDALISLIVAGNPAAGAGDGVNGNDRNYLTVFPFVALPHHGLNGGHRGTNRSSSDANLSEDARTTRQAGLRLCIAISNQEFPDETPAADTLCRAADLGLQQDNTAARKHSVGRDSCNPRITGAVPC
ncbi:MAG: DUF4331 family protein [Pseudomonadota bacterium]|nr:DUF4331 family protein [Pseudomonadota bacterium]